MTPFTMIVSSTMITPREQHSLHVGIISYISNPALRRSAPSARSIGGGQIIVRPHRRHAEPAQAGRVLREAVGRGRRDFAVTGQRSQTLIQRLHAKALAGLNERI